MFSGLIKILLLTAPVVGIVLFVVFMKMGKHEAKMDVEGAKFDQDFAVMQQSMSNTKTEKKHWEARKLEAGEEIEKAKKLEMEATDIDKELKNDMLDAAKEFGKEAKVDKNGKVIVPEKK